MSRWFWILIGIAIGAFLWAFLGLWLPYKMLVWLGTDQLPARGQFGDQFGAANALFTGMALVGAIIALALQERSQTKQLMIARQTALLQSLLDFSKMQADEMKGTDPDNLDDMIRVANEYNRKAFQIITEELKVEFAFNTGKFPPAGIFFNDPKRRAFSEMVGIADDFQKAISPLPPRQNNSIVTAIDILRNLRTAIADWITKHSKEIPNNYLDSIKKLQTHVGDMTSIQAEQPDEVRQKWWDKLYSLPTEIRKAVGGNRAKDEGIA